VYSYLYETDDKGGYTKEVTTPGTVEISGCFHSTARHRFIIWWNGSNYQLTKWFFVDDYADAWQRATIILPLSFESRSIPDLLQER
jgi:hypothetical protein